MKKVLFVCVHNAGRSQMAEAFFNHIADGKSKADSAGTAPASVVDSRVIELMQELDIDMSDRKPKIMTQEMVDESDMVITMGCGVEGVCPATFVETDDWGIDDPKGKSLDDIRKIRDNIREKVVDLLNKMQGS